MDKTIYKKEWLGLMRFMAIILEKNYEILIVIICIVFEKNEFLVKLYSLNLNEKKTLLN